MGFGLESNKNVKLTGEENIVDGVLLRNFDFFEFFSICISSGFVAVVGTRRVWWIFIVFKLAIYIGNTDGYYH